MSDHGNNYHTLPMGWGRDQEGPDKPGGRATEAQREATSQYAKNLLGKFCTHSPGGCAL